MFTLSSNSYLLGQLVLLVNIVSQIKGLKEVVGLSLNGLGSPRVTFLR